MERTMRTRTCLLAGLSTTMVLTASLWWLKPEWTTAKVRALEVGAAFVSGSLLLYVWLFLPERQTRPFRSFLMGIFLASLSLLLTMLSEYLGTYWLLVVVLILILGYWSDRRSAQWDDLLE